MALSSSSPPEPRRSIGRRVLDALTPGAEHLGPALATVALGLVPLSALRLWVAHGANPSASWADLWRVLYGEAEEWCLVGLAGAMVLRHAGRARPVARLGLHLFGALLLLASLVELVFFAVTGGRADVDVLMFAWDDAPQVAPVFLSEVKPVHVALVIGALAVGLAPALLTFRPRGPAFGRYAWLLLLPVLLVEAGGRTRPHKTLRLLQPSLIEQLWWDGLDRMRDVSTPPAPGELTPIQLTPGERPPFNVVLVLLESVGAGATSIHSPQLATTPFLQSMAEKGWWARNMYAVVPHTSKAIVTTMCGTWPALVTEIREATPGGLLDRCLPRMLSELGYRTAFFQTADENFERRGALTHQMGFDLFRSRDTLRGPGFAKVNYFGVEDRAMLEPGLAWSKSSKQPFFATYLTLTTHHDYTTPPGWPKADYPGVTGRKTQYLDALRYVDDFLGRLVKGYEEAGLLDNTLFVVLGDHGEAFGEHGRSMHDLVIYDEGLHIPLVLYGPGVLPGTGIIEGNRQQIDVVPTILGLLGVTWKGGVLEGESLLGPPDPGRTLFHSCWRPHRCLARRTGPHKLVDIFRDGPPQYFETDQDPAERSDRLATLPATAVEAGREEARAWRARVVGRYEAAQAGAIARRQALDDSPARATWGGKLDLVKCAVETPEVLPGEAVWLACRWRLKEKLDQSWRAVTAIDGSFTTSVERALPLDGLLPTYKWTPGLAVDDELRVFVPVDAKPGLAHVGVGWERYGELPIPTEGGAERVPVGTVTILPALHPGMTEAPEVVGDVPEEDE